MINLQEQSEKVNQLLAEIKNNLDISLNYKDIEEAMFAPNGKPLCFGEGKKKNCYLFANYFENPSGQGYCFVYGSNKTGGKYKFNIFKKNHVVKERCVTEKDLDQNVDQNKKEKMLEALWEKEIPLSEANQEQKNGGVEEILIKVQQPVVLLEQDIELLGRIQEQQKEEEGNLPKAKKHRG